MPYNMKSSGTLGFLILLAGHSVSAARLVKRQSPGASASSSSSGSIPNGSLNLNNYANTYFSEPNSFSASASTSNTGNGPNAVISSVSSANSVVGELPPGYSVYGVANGASQGAAASGQLSNNDQGNVYLFPGSISADGSSSITGAGTEVQLQSDATSNMVPNQRRKIKKANHKALGDPGPNVGASAQSSGNVPSGEVTLNNNANSNFNNFIYYYPTAIPGEATSPRPPRPLPVGGQSSSSVPSPGSPPIIIEPPCCYPQPQPQMNSQGWSQNTAQGTNVQLQSTGSADGATGVLTGNNLVGNANAGSTGTADTGSLNNNDFSNVNGQPGQYAYGSGNSNIHGSGTGVHVQSLTNSNLTDASSAPASSRLHRKVLVGRKSGQSVAGVVPHRAATKGGDLPKRVLLRVRQPVRAPAPVAKKSQDQPRRIRQ